MYAKNAASAVQYWIGCVFLQFWSIFTSIALASAVGFIELCNLEGN